MRKTEKWVNWGEARGIHTRNINSSGRHLLEITNLGTERKTREQLTYKGICWVNKLISLSGPNSVILESAWILNRPQVHAVLVPAAQTSATERPSFRPSSGSVLPAVVDGIPTIAVPTDRPPDYCMSSRNRRRTGLGVLSMWMCRYGLGRRGNVLGTSRPIACLQVWPASLASVLEISMR